MAFPVQDVAYEFTVHLVDVNNPDRFLIDPPIEAGDFRITLGGGPLFDLDILPTVVPAGSSFVLIQLTAAEMQSKVNIIARDQGDNPVWEEMGIFIDVPTGSVESIFDLEEGDRTETFDQFSIKKRGTATILLQKDITGSLLSDNVTIKTLDP